MVIPFGTGFLSPLQSEMLQESFILGKEQAVFCECEGTAERTHTDDTLLLSFDMRNSQNTICGILLPHSIVFFGSNRTMRTCAFGVGNCSPRKI
jgi:hypothetical protein